MRNYKLIGLTGQSGAGKSAAAEVFRSLGATVLNADEMVSRLYQPPSVCLKMLSSVFGADILLSDGSLDRRLLAERAFSSQENTALLGKLVHPFVTAVFFERLKGAEGVVVYDAPQLFESGADVICDCVAAVTAPAAVRLKRIMERDNLTETEARRRMDAQLSEAFFREHADFVIDNNGSEKDLTAAVKAIYQEVR